ncbi:PE-PPE domain-containing protein [Mycobacterium sp. M1]|uniref:PE-PPE domain-containing protein n=1 Tax=Mycolicibacter acidiphilus TaxID=2835306 RepID=A0ABS5RGQ8_9MYCO|nr:PE-PPE domain-containing protein [Mycolicibacter acidiphilus]MBS9533477.1 PE-PPE domain-containing protein [Mycolicibacter acidiphilus]
MKTTVVTTMLTVAVAATTSDAVMPEAVSARTDATTLTGVTLIMGGTGQPTMPFDLVERIISEYTDHLHPGRYTDPVALTTPEEFSGESYRVGERILADALATHRDEDVLVFGVSQSAGIQGMLLNDGIAGIDADPDRLAFVALAPPTWPEHGLFEGANHAAMTLLFGSDVTASFPVDADIPVDVYCGEYDPICDTPTNLGNALATWNAMAALGTVHAGYVDLTSGDIDAAVPVDMGGSVQFWMIPTEHLPMLAGVWGTPLEDVLDPILRPMIDAAYDTPTHGLEAASAAADLLSAF